MDSNEIVECAARDIEFANHKVSGIGSCGAELPAVYLGKIYYDESIASIKPLVLQPRNIQKQDAPFVQRVRHNAIIRDGEKSYKVNGAGTR